MKVILLALWGIWDFIYFSCNRMQFVSKEDNLFRIVRKKYSGPPLRTKSGEWIYSGDEIIKLHIYNYGLAKEISGFRSEMSFALYVKSKMKKSLVGLSEFVYNQPDVHRIKAIIGTSMSNKSAERFGFCVHEVNDSLYFWFKSYVFKMIYIMVNPYGFEYLRSHKNRLQSKHVVMSVNELFDLYLQRSRC
jgi:hypothetical protein